MPTIHPPESPSAATAPNKASRVPTARSFAPDAWSVSTRRALVSAINDRTCVALLWSAIAGYLLLLLGLTFRLYDRFTIMAYDLGIFDQAVWLIAGGQTPFVTIRGLHILADHFSVVLYLIAPLYHVWPSPKLLLAMQNVALALGALPLFALARERLGSARVAFLFACAYLLYPAVQWSGAFEFHPETLATPLFLCAFLFLTRAQWVAYFGALVLAALTKETVGLTIVALGLYALVSGRPRRISLLTIGLGLVALLVSMAVVRAFNNGAPSPFFALYGRYGGSLPEIFLFLLRHPFTLVRDLASDLNQQYLLRLLFPLLFLVLLAPDVLLIAVPALLSNLLSSRYVMHTIEHQYTVLITPFIFIAAVIGFERARKRGNRHTQVLMLTYLCVWMVVGVRDSPLVAWGGRVTPGLTPSQVGETRQILGRIPPTASVSAQGTLMAHLSHRTHIYAFPNPFHSVAYGYGARALRQMEQKEFYANSRAQRNRALAAAPVEYVALCPPATIYPLLPHQYVAFATAALRSPAYGIVAIGEHTVLLRRGADHQQGLRRLEQQTGKRIRRDHNQGHDVDEAFRRWTKGVPLCI